MSRPPYTSEPHTLVAAGEHVQAGRLHESAHRLDEAVDAYLRGGAYNDAARVLSHQGRFRDAGETLLYYLPKDPTPIHRLTPEARRHALNAALCFARGGARREAVGLLLNLGENQKAASLLSLAGLRQEAVRVMRGESIDGSPWPQGIVFPLRPPPRPGAARHAPRPQSSGGGDSVDRTPSARLSRRSVPGEMVSRSGASRRPDPPQQSAVPDRAVTRTLGGDGGRDLLELQPGDPRLPEAVQEVLRSRWGQDPLSPWVLQFLDRYVEAGAQGMAREEERPAFYAIARLYEYHDRMGAARKAYQVASAGGGVADAEFRLQQLDAGLVQTTEGEWLPLHMVMDGKRFQFAELPALERLPPLGYIALALPETMDFDDSMLVPEASSTFSSSSQTVSPQAQPSTSWSARANESDATRFDEARTEHTGNEFGPISEGSVVADRYRIEALIGQGGMGTVYRALDMELEEVIAIKVFQQVVRNEKGLERFRREMKLSRKLIHPNVVRVYEFGTCGGARYITMELLSGMDLDEYLRVEGGALPTAQALSLMMQCCDGLGAAHKQGVVHRDIKPQNLFVVDGGKRLKVMDFGIAKVSDETSISVTGVRIGTPRYMSPEQIQGGVEVGPATDLYALGGVMYELFTGSPVFDEDELVPLLLNHMTEEPIPPSQRNPGVPPAVEHVILRLLQKAPEDRYRDTAELKRELLSAYVQAERLPNS